MYSLPPKMSRQFVLERVSQEQIMERYLHLPVQTHSLVRNPGLGRVKPDAHPTAGFAYSRNGRLLFRDFAGYFFGDCFDVVNELCFSGTASFLTVCERIVADFELGNKPALPHLEVPSLAGDYRSYSRIEVNRQPWTEVDKAYWRSQMLDSATLKRYQVSSVMTAWLDSRIIYNYYPNDPAYEYFFSEAERKLYFPMRGKGESRFVGNCSGLQGYRQLPPYGDLLVWNKSLKDVMVCSRMDIPSVAPHGEDHIVEPYLVDELKMRFRNHIWLGDNDEPGILCGKRQQERTGIPFHCYDRQLGKDTTEVASRIGLYHTKDIILTMQQNED